MEEGNVIKELPDRAPGFWDEFGLVLDEWVYEVVTYLRPYYCGSRYVTTLYTSAHG